VVGSQWSKCKTAAQNLTDHGHPWHSAICSVVVFARTEGHGLSMVIVVEQEEEGEVKLHQTFQLN
jgi:hypothetical protein